MNTLRPSREELFWPFRQRFDKLFDSFFGSDSLNAVKSLARSGHPKVDAFRDEGDLYRIQLSVPGVRLGDLKVEVVQEVVNGFEVKVLRVSGQMERRYQVSEKAVFDIREMRRSAFQRALILPDHLVGDPDAVLDDGILTLTWKVKEVEEAPKTKLISVREKT